MLEFELLENIPTNQCIDLPFIIYQSKPKSQKNRIYLTNFDKNLILSLTVFGIIGFLVMLIIGYSQRDSATILVAWLTSIFSLIFIGLYREVSKNISNANKLASLDLPQFFPFIVLDKERFKIYGRDSQLKFDIPINELKKIKVDCIKAIYNLNFYFHNYQKNTKEFIMSIHDIDFHINIDEKNYYLSGETIVYFVNYIRFMQNKNPILDHVIFNKRHFMNGFPLDDKYISFANHSQ